MSLFEAELDTSLDLFEMEDGQLINILFAFAGELSTLRNQTVQFPITYYFGVQSRRGNCSAIHRWFGRESVSAASLAFLKVGRPRLGGCHHVLLASAGPPLLALARRNEGYVAASL